MHKSVVSNIKVSVAIGYEMKKACAISTGENFGPAGGQQARLCLRLLKFPKSASEFCCYLVVHLSVPTAVDVDVAVSTTSEHHFSLLSISMSALAKLNKLECEIHKHQSLNHTQGPIDSSNSHTWNYLTHQDDPLI